MTPVQKAQQATQFLEEAIIEVLQQIAPEGMGPADMSRTLQIYRGGDVPDSGPRLNDGIVTGIMDKLEEDGRIFNDKRGQHGHRGRRYLQEPQ